MKEAGQRPQWKKRPGAHEPLAPFIEQAMMQKEKVAPLSDEKIPRFVVLGCQVANEPQLTPEQEAARRRSGPRHGFHSKIRRSFRGGLG
jgi:hypothetical protein